MSDNDSSRREVLKRGALLTGALVPGALATGVEASAARGPFDVRDFGGKGDGTTFDTAALQGAIDACHAAGGGTVHVPAGTWLTKPFRILSHVTLHLDAGALVLGSPHLEDYAVEGEDASGESEREGVVTARGAERVAIVGRGTIDGNALAFHDETTSHAPPDFDRRFVRQGEDFMPDGEFFEHGPLAHGERPGNLLRVFGCRDVLVHGVTIQNSPTWTSHYNDCENVTIEAIRINSDASGTMIPNDDGIDIKGCRDVRILACDIDTGDDCIAIFGSERVSVTSCTLSTRSLGIRVGYTGGDIRDCVFTNLVIHRANRGLGVFVRGAGSVENVIFSDIVLRTTLFTGHWWGKGEPIHVSAMLWDPEATTAGRIRNVTFSRIRAEGEAGVVVWGTPDNPIENVLFDDVQLKVKRGPQSDAYGGNVDLRSAPTPEESLFGRDLPALLAKDVGRIRLRGFEVEWGEDVPAFFTHAVECEGFRELEVERFRGRQAQSTGSALRLVRGEDAVVRNSRATEGTDVFVESRDVTGRAVLAGNDVRAARTPTVPAGFGRRDHGPAR
ncbi:MAG: right-handed parallel beta-helix repeat-containing protein [Acidobacteria bacterium]|nr:right-handed parallel beta-helix repeat-containing protein [Acidobacteriota bacterium]